MSLTNNSARFSEALELLDFGSEASISSLQYTGQLKSQAISSVELFALETAGFYKADAVYFRKFENRQPIPQIYLYDNTSNKLDSKEYANIQRDLWSSCVIPLFIIVEKSRLLIFDSRKPVDTFFYEISATPIEILNFTAQAVKEYSAKFFDNGTFWEQTKNSKYFLESTSSYNDLLTGLKKIRTSFLKKSNLPSRTAHKLLVLSILVKYLEERGDDGETLFAKNFFKQFEADNFCGVLRNKGQVVKMFKKLGEHFNGKIFAWEDKTEVDLLRNCDLTILADFLDANIQEGQYVLWRRYSFNRLPVELISSVYEEFLGEDKNDVVYTPHFLVNMLVDESMPLDLPQVNFKLIDGSCGSGIFLVAAFKRLVEWWRYNKYLELGELPSNPKLKTLKELLRTSIYGVDVEEDATRLTIFSLALALCDLLTPKQIWTELTFDDLSANNIKAEDFFHFLGQSDNKFDLVIGNPPFIELNKNKFDSIVKSNKLMLDSKIPQNQIALLFLDQAMRLLKPNSLLCLIMPSGPLLYNDTLDFRKYFFKKNKVSQIIDFTNLSSTLFGKASVATAAIFVHKRESDNSEILHVTVRRTKPSKEKIFFEIDHYDFHKVSQEASISEQYIWKSNLLGGGRLNFLINRLAELPTLGSYLKQKKSSNGWIFGDGFIKGKSDSEITASDREKKKGGYDKASFLTNSICFNPEDFDETGIKKRFRLKDIFFQWKRNRELFQGPLLLIKKNIGRSSIPVHYNEKPISFRNEIVGIHSPYEDRELLKKIESAIRENQTYRFYLSVTSARAGISRSVSTLLQEDILNLPYTEADNDLKLSYTEKILRDDVIKYYLEQISKGENSLTNNTSSEAELKQFGTTFCKALNSIYEDGQKKFRSRSVREADTFFAFEFSYSASEVENIKFISTPKAESNISELVRKEVGKTLRINRVVNFYAKDRIYLIKPKQLRYWLKSVALRDADQALNDLVKAGY